VQLLDWKRMLCRGEFQTAASKKRKKGVKLVLSDAEASRVQKKSGKC
jgi:hypothetical protein